MFPRLFLQVVWGEKAWFSHLKNPFRDPWSIFKHHLYLEVHHFCCIHFLWRIGTGFLGLTGFTHVAKHCYELTLRIITVDLVDIVVRSPRAFARHNSNTRTGRSKRRQTDVRMSIVEVSTNYIRCWICVRAFDFCSSVLMWMEYPTLSMVHAKLQQVVVIPEGKTWKPRGKRGFQPGFFRKYHNHLSMWSREYPPGFGSLVLTYRYGNIWESFDTVMLLNRFFLYTLSVLMYTPFHDFF